MTRRKPPTADLPDMTPYLAALGHRVLSLRRMQRLTQIEVCRAAGVSRTFFAHIERGEFPANISLLFRLAHVLGTPLRDLLPDDHTGRYDRPLVWPLPPVPTDPTTSTRSTDDHL